MVKREWFGIGDLDGVPVSQATWDTLNQWAPTLSNSSTDKVQAWIDLARLLRLGNQFDSLQTDGSKHCRKKILSISTSHDLPNDSADESGSQRYRVRRSWSLV